jgi:hypothetical protein
MALGDTLRTLSLAEAERLPLWRRPVALLALMAFAMPIAFATWSALLNNFVIEVAGFDGADIGWLHTVREIPGLFRHRGDPSDHLHPRTGAGDRVAGPSGRRPLRSRRSSRASAAFCS